MVDSELIEQLAGAMIRALEVRPPRIGTLISATHYYPGPAWRTTMATSGKRNVGSDRKRVAGGQEHEVKYEAKKMGVSKQVVKETVKDVGVSRGKVEKKLESKR